MKARNIILSVAIVSLGLWGCASDAPDRHAAPLTGLLPWSRPFEVAEDVYPFASQVYWWNGLAYHYIDQLPPDGREPLGTVLAVHGNATWSFIYRKIVAPLTAAGFRVIATDQFGYGMSDKPSASEFSYLPSEHAVVLTDFIRALDLSDIYLVVQDWGGPIGFAAGIADPARVAGLVVMNTWAWRLPEIADGSTDFMHAVHDRGVHAATQPTMYTDGTLVRRGGIGVASRNAPQGTPRYYAIRNAMWGPYLALAEPFPLLHETALDPVHISAMATLQDGAFLAAIEENLAVLSDKPVFFAFGDDTAFGPYKVDLGFLGGPRQLCRDGFTPEATGDQLGVRTNCLDANGQPYWYPLERLMSAWSADSVVGVWTDASVGHWVQDEAPEVVIDAVLQVHALAADRGANKPRR